MNLFNQMFGIASSAAYIRCGGAGDATRSVLAALATGFGGPTGNGAYVHDLFASNGNVFSQSGFDESSLYYNSIEQNVTGLGNAYSRIGAAAIIYAYSNISNVSIEQVLGGINTYCSYINILIGESYGNFTEKDLNHTLSHFSIEDVNTELSSLPKSVISKAINYNWYDSEPLFLNTSLNSVAQVIKDVENQYYYLSGELLFDTSTSSLFDCIEYSQSVSTPTGVLEFNVIANTPCRNIQSSVGPVSGIRFFRMFNDGPGSSGIFDAETMLQYEQWDEQVIDPSDRYSNNVVLYSNTRDVSGNYIYLKDGQQIDFPGYFRSGNEYGNGHTNFISEGCTNHPEWPMMRMHQGDTGQKWYFESYLVGTYPNQTCYYTSGRQDWTGWKMAPFYLKDDSLGHFNGVVGNPKFDKSRVLKRALNLENYEGPHGEIHSPYANVTSDGSTLICNGIVGPPQLSSEEPTLPAFCFVQTFDNSTFPEFVSVTIRAALLSGGSYVISQNDLFSTGIEQHFPVFGGHCQIPIYQVVPSSGMKSMDEITKKCLSIGDGFGNSEISGYASSQSNAGYDYSGYSYLSGGVPVSEYDLINRFSSKVAAKYSKIKYISGYTGVGGEKYSLTNKYAFISDGPGTSPTPQPGVVTSYKYLSDGVLGAVNTGWTTFAPTPPNVINNPTLYGNMYGEQRVENYFPRFDSGPYAVSDNTFLYPNAQDGYEKFNARVEGFPRTFFYEMSFKEETVREIYKTNTLNGVETFINVIRATGNTYYYNNGTGALRTRMRSPFIADNELFAANYSFDNQSLYNDNGDFYYTAMPFSSTDGMVDENFVFDTDFCVDDKLNSINYSTAEDVAYEPTLWRGGVRINSGLSERKIYTKKNVIGKKIVPQNINLELAWGYYGRTWTGRLDYTFPMFHLDTKQVNIDQDLLNKISSITDASLPIVFYTHQSPTFDGSNYGLLGGNTSISGQEPIFYENIGGRIGQGSELEGGNNSQGIVGDAWYDFTGKWGMINSYYPASQTYPYTKHGPEEDSHLFFMSLKPTQLEIYSKNLSYYPYYYSRKYQPFNESISHPGIVTVTRRLANESENYFDFDLFDLFPTSKMLSEDGLFYESGLNIGPFDMDIELCVSSGNSLIPGGNLIMDGMPITIFNAASPNSYTSTVEERLVADFSTLYPSDRIVPGENGRSRYITTFKLIPKNTPCNINISGTVGMKIGLTGESIVTIRPRTFFGNTTPQILAKGSDQYKLSEIYGEWGYLNPLRFIKNGTEEKFVLPYSSIESLEGSTFYFQTESREQTYYPKPPDPMQYPNDFFKNVSTGVDSLGNTTYPQTPTKLYWQKVNPNIETYRVRDVTRVRFKINKIFESGLGQIPYQNQNTIVAQGDCIISGVFGYTGQAESAIISNGIVLSGISGASALSGVFEPIYVSQVLERIPSGIFAIPSGEGIHSTLPAPSYMKKRKNYFYITGNDEYISASPFSDSHYNAFLWPAWSDLALLNPEIVYEEIPPEDGNVFNDSYLTFSASQGQSIGTGNNPSEDVTYGVIAKYGFIDSVSTNSIYNTGECIFSGEALKTGLHSGDLSGILTAEGNSLTMAMNLRNFSV